CAPRTAGRGACQLPTTQLPISKESRSSELGESRTCKPVGSPSPGCLERLSLGVGVFGVLEVDGPRIAARGLRNRPEPRPRQLTCRHQAVLDREQARELCLPGGV